MGGAGSEEFWGMVKEAVVGPGAFARYFAENAPKDPTKLERLKNFVTRTKSRSKDEIENTLANIITSRFSGPRLAKDPVLGQAGKLQVPLKAERGMEHVPFLTFSGGIPAVRKYRVLEAAKGQTAELLRPEMVEHAEHALKSGKGDVDYAQTFMFQPGAHPAAARENIARSLRVGRMASHANDPDIAHLLGGGRAAEGPFKGKLFTDWQYVGGRHPTMEEALAVGPSLSSKLNSRYGGVGTITDILAKPDNLKMVRDAAGRERPVAIDFVAQDPRRRLRMLQRAGVSPSLQQAMSRELLKP